MSIHVFKKFKVKTMLLISIAQRSKRRYPFQKHGGQKIFVFSDRSSNLINGPMGQPSQFVTYRLLKHTNVILIFVFFPKFVVTLSLAHHKWLNSNFF